MPVTVPDRSPSSLGPALSNTRAPTTNELSAVHVEEIKDVLIDLANAVNAPDLEVATANDTAITVTSLDGLAGPLEIKPYGLSGLTDIEITPTITASGPGKGLSLLAGQGALDEDGGPVSLDAGQGNGTGDGGNVRIGRDNAAEVLIGKEGGGAAITLEGTVTTLMHTPTNADDVATKGYVDAPITPGVISGTTYTVQQSDHGKTYACTNAGGCTVTVPDNLEPGTMVGFYGTLAEVFFDDTDGTPLHSADFWAPPDLATAGAYSLGVIQVTDDPTEYLVTGDLEPA